MSSDSESELDDLVLYEVERIIDKKTINDKVYYLIKWKLWPDEFNTWEEE